ncbi:MAG: GTPase HflX, partial [Selenomonadaceae bacterium]|nr:GTPase HflX [Selenomonadaceae bacterium]
MIHGELKNIKKSVLESLEGLYELAVPAGQLVTREISELMLAVTAELQREVAVYINRQGKVLQVSVGDDATVDLPEIRQRKSENRLSGVRCVHTHPSSDTRLSAPDLSSLRSMRFDVMAAIGMKDGRIYGSMAFLSGELTESGGYVVHGTKELPIGDLNRYNLMQLVTAINKELGRNQLKETEKRQERAILAGVDYNASAGGWSIEDSLTELKGLAETAGAQVA